MVDANGDILKSGGTVFIRVSDPQNKELQVIKPLRFAIPTKEQDSRMGLYAGEYSKKGDVKWSTAR